MTNQILVSLIITIIDVARDKLIPSLVKNPTRLTSVTPTPAGNSDRAPNNRDENVIKVVKIISKLTLKPTKTKKIAIASMVNEIMLIDQFFAIFRANILV